MCGCGTKVLGVSEDREKRQPDFIDRGLGLLDHALDVVHDRVLRPILVAGRVVAYGFILLLVAIFLLCVVVIGLLRVLNVYLFAGHEWLSYAIIGSLLLLAGLIIWRRRYPVKLEK